MNIKIEGWKVTIHNENGDSLELNSEFESEFFKEYDNKQLIIADVVGQSGQLVCDECGDTGRSYPTLQEPDGVDCEKCKAN